MRPTAALPDRLAGALLSSLDAAVDELGHGAGWYPSDPRGCSGCLGWVMTQAQPLDDRGLPPGYLYDPAREITPREVKEKMDRGENLLLIDCRRPDEWEITRIEGARLIPLQELPEHFDDELAGQEGEEVVVYCRSGRRSLDFAQSLLRSGFRNVRSMAGGILLWNRDVNPGGPQY